MGISYADLDVDDDYLSRSYDGVTVSSAEQETRFELFMTDFRDRLRASAGADWQVSDIAKWTGSLTIKGYGIRVRRMVAGSPQGFEFVMMFGGVNGSTRGNARWLVNGDIRTKTISKSDGNYAGSYTPAIFWHSSADTITFDGGWNSSGVMTSGDFTNPASSGGISPGSNFTGWQNTCLEFDGAILPTYSTEGYEMLVTLDSEENVAMFWTNSGSGVIANTLFMCGDIHDIDPVNVGDTYPEGLYWAQFTTRDDITSANEECHGKNTAGTILKNFTVYVNTVGSNLSNQLRNSSPLMGTSPRDIDGVHSSKKVPCIAAGYDKGWIKPGLMLEMGAANYNYVKHQHCALFDGPAAGKKYLKISRICCYLFPEGVPPPFVGYPLAR